MNKIIYIIPGFMETCRRKPYQLLANKARQKGYEVVFKNVDWEKKLSPQVFTVPKNSVIFGFSLGAVLGRLVAQNSSCTHLILASMTPLRDFEGGKTKKTLSDFLGLKYVNDVRDHLNLKHRARKQTLLYGDKEEEPGDILVPNTQHELNTAYIREISKLI
jgi:hypothetical protein